MMFFNRFYASERVSILFHSIGWIRNIACHHSVFIRYINNVAVSENLSFCKTLKLHTKCENMFQCVNGFFTQYSFPWEKCAGICTDGAAGSTAFKSRIVKRIKDKASNAKCTYCFLHKEALPQKIARKNCTTY